LQTLEKERKKERKELIQELTEDISKYVSNQASLALQRRNIIKRLRLGLENLNKTQQFMNEQMNSFNQYLEVARQQQVANKDKKGKKKKKTEVFKFSYNQLSKKGVIVDSSVPQKSRKATTFIISKGDNVNEFLVKAKIAGITVDTISLLLDDLLEKQSQSIAELKLEQVTLNINMTIHIINKIFIKA